MQSKLVLFLAIFILSISFFSTKAIAEGCCFTSTGCLTELTQEQCETDFGSLYPDIPTTGSLAFSANSCEQASNNALCTDFGCCCQDENNYFENVPGYTCQTESFTFYSGQLCSDVCSQTPPANQEFELTGQVFDENGLHPTSSTVSLFEEQTLTTYDVTITDSEPYSFMLRSDYYYSLQATDGACSAAEPFFRIDQNTTIDLTLDCGSQQDCSLEWDCTYPQLVNGVACGNPSCTLTDPNACLPVGFNINDCHPDTQNNCPANVIVSSEPGFVLCPNPQGDCGNGIVDPGEQCDNTNLQGLQCSDIGGFSAGTLACDPQTCQFDTSNCDNCPTSAELCQQTSQCDCSICQNEPLCVQEVDCSDKAPTNVDLAFIQASADVDITWSMPLSAGESCEVQLQDFKITRCDESAGGGCEGNYVTQVYDKLDVALSYPTRFGSNDTNLEPQKSYCWEVIAVYYDNLGQITESSATVCESTGHQECMQPHTDQMCINNNGYQCDENNHLSLLLECSTEEMCLGPFPDGTVQCKDAAVCDLCNGAYGMYSYLGLDVEALVDGTIVTLPCDQNPVSYGGGPLNPYCYSDTTLTVGDQYDACSQVSTCYDYYDQTSCEQNHCLHPSTESCAWRPLSTFGEELGKGLCVPADVQEVDCGRCHTDTYLGPSCYEDMCELYSSVGDDACYYAGRDIGNSITYECLHKDEITCSDYTSKNDCVAATDRRIGDSTGAFANIEYLTFVDSDSMIAGTNVFDHISNDRYQLQTCQWSDAKNKCIKNADNFTLITGQGFIFADDCSYLSGDEEAQLKCIQDNEPPITTLNLKDPASQPASWNAAFPVYGKGSALDFTWSATDDTYPAEDISSRFSLEATSQIILPLSDIPTTSTTYDDPVLACQDVGGVCVDVCRYASGDGGISWSLSCGLGCGETPVSATFQKKLFWQAVCDPAGSVVYPTNSFEQLQADNTGSADYTFRYFSFDAARNFELINQDSITIDAFPPTPLSVELVDTPFSTDPDNWYSDLTITFSYTDDHPDITCQNTLRLLGNNQTTFSADDTYVADAGVVLTQQYTFLEDADYIYTMTCNDALGNTAIYEYSLTLEADKRITNSTPTGIIYGPNDPTQVTISIGTQRGATCKYKSIWEEDYLHPVSGAGGHSFSKDALGTTHTATVSPNTNSYHVYYVGCDFGGGEIVEGNLGDLIYFSLDHNAPTTQMWDVGVFPNVLYEPILPAELLEFDLICSDHDDSLVIGGIDPLYFNNEVVHYCLGPEVPTDPNNPCTFDVWPNVPMSLTPEDVQDFNTVYYYCEDSGGNAESIQSQRVFLRDLNFAEPCIQVCNPLTGVCESSGNCP